MAKFYGYNIVIHDPFETASALKTNFMVEYLKMSVFKITPKITNIDESLMQEPLEL